MASAAFGEGDFECAGAEAGGSGAMAESGRAAVKALRGDAPSEGAGGAPKEDGQGVGGSPPERGVPDLAVLSLVDRLHQLLGAGREALEVAVTLVAEVALRKNLLFRVRLRARGSATPVE
jgi:hypothetical protein